ncbi:hypothetical protein IF803_23215 [Bradyrhizobium sp. UFLA06-06]
MPSVISTGTVRVKTAGKEYGLESVPVSGMKAADQVLLTPYISPDGISGPDRKGPLYCAFIDEKKDGGFDVLVYDIQGGKFDVTVVVDWAVVHA